MQELPRQAAGVVRIAHFGGSFNPVHEGHVAIVRQLRERYGFERVVVCPTGDRSPEAVLAPGRIRLAMLQAALAGIVGVRIDAGELEREEPTPTFASLQRVRARVEAEVGDCHLFCVRGCDSLQAMASWRSLPELARDFPIVVVPRGSGGEPDALLASHPGLAAIRSLLFLAGALEIPEVSSTAVRRSVMLERVVPPTVPPGAARILRAGGAYGLTPPSEEWITLCRPGYSGSTKRRRDRERDDLYGAGAWRTAFRW